MEDFIGQIDSIDAFDSRQEPDESVLTKEPTGLLSPQEELQLQQLIQAKYWQR